MSEIRVNRIVNAAGSGAPQFPSGFSLATGMGITNSPNITGSAVTFSGLSQITNATDSTSTTTGSLVVTGGVGIAKNVYIGAGLSVAGTLTYEDVTSVDSVGLITAKSGIDITGGGFEQTGGGEFKVGTGVTIASTAGVSTFSKDVTFLGAAYSITFDQSTDDLIFGDNAKLAIGSGSDLTVYHDGSNTYLNNATGEVVLYTSSASDIVLKYNSTERLRITGAGATSVGISTFQHFSSIGMLKERVEIIANKLSAATNINLDSGNIHYFTTNETGTATPNIRYSSAQSLNNKMLIGETVAVSIIFKPNNAGYYAQMTIDGSAQTEEWLGGSAPAAANSSGYDVITYQITKTADATFLVLANSSNYA